MEPLVGREHEIETLDGLVGRVSEVGSALVLEGQAGIGKSALLDHATQTASRAGLEVVEAVGVQAESHIPFAGLEFLLHPFASDVGALPHRQRDALRSALGLDIGITADRFLVAQAALTLIGDAAARRPLLLLLRDAQWLDRPTCDAMTFIARRLADESVVLLIEIREGYDSPFAQGSLPVMRVGPLDMVSAATLLDARLEGLSSEARSRLLEVAAGNPLALVELLEDASPDVIRGTDPIPPIADRLERTFAARFSDMPTVTRSYMIAAAVNDTEALDEVVKAGAMIAEHTGVEALLPAAEARLIEVDGAQIRFRHPLVRSAIQRAATQDERGAAHAALADVLADFPDRRTWHRAASAEEPDDVVAAELDLAATRAMERGAPAVAMAALERAAQLSDVNASRATYLLRASDIAFDLGRYEHVIRNVQAAESLELPPQIDRRVRWTRDLYLEPNWPGAERIRGHLALVDSMRADGDTEAATGALVLLALRCWWAYPDPEIRHLIWDVAQRMPMEAPTPGLLVTIAAVGPPDEGSGVLERVAHFDADPGLDPVAMRFLGLAASVAGDLRGSLGFFDASAEGLRRDGRLGLLAQTLVSRAWAAFHLGDWMAAASTAEECCGLALESGQPRLAAAARAVEACLAAVHGDTSRAEKTALEVEQLALPMGGSSLLAIAQLARGLAALANGQQLVAFERLRRLFAPDDVAYHPFVSQWAFVDLAEAAALAGVQQEMGPIVAMAEGLAQQNPAPWFEMSARFARPLLARGEPAEELFKEVLDPALIGWPFQRGRLLLLYGMLLRRDRRVAESRAPLRAARDAFDALGAVPWSDRARSELRASGETSRPPSIERWAELTPQELQIAQLAADGFTNREIGERLYLSHRTIGSHLYRLFPKLGISSRAQLASAMESRPGTDN